MGNSAELGALIEAASAGDRCATDGLLVREYEPLLAFIRSQDLKSLAGRVAAEDLLQESLLRAARGIKGFNLAQADGFRAWLHAIAQNVIRDARKAQEAARRDKRREARSPRAAPDESIVGLLDLLPVSGRTPSQSVARREAVAAIRVALASISEDYRLAIRHRYLDGLDVKETAKRMKRSERAIHMLCNRGLKALAEAMGSASMFLSKA
jgi:RNA polymerase sigma-70 factor (ECF subfamily)